MNTSTENEQHLQKINSLIFIIGGGSGMFPIGGGAGMFIASVEGALFAIGFWGAFVEDIGGGIS